MYNANGIFEGGIGGRKGCGQTASSLSFHFCLKNTKPLNPPFLTFAYIKTLAFMPVTLESLSPNLIADNVNASVDFYTKHLGFKLVASVPETGEFGWAMVQRDSVTIMFQSLKSIEEDVPGLGLKKGSSGTFFIKMKGVDEIYKSVKGKVKIPMDMRTTFYGMKEFIVEDPDGYYMMFAEDK